MGRKSKKSLTGAETPKKVKKELDADSVEVESKEALLNGAANGSPKKKGAKVKTPKKIAVKEEQVKTEQVANSPKKLNKRKSVDPPESPKEKKAQVSKPVKKTPKKKKKALKAKENEPDSSDEELEKEGDLVGEEDVPASDDEDTVEEKRAKYQRVKEIEEEKNTRTIFIGNLPKEISKEKIEQLFKKFGKIESVRYRNAPVADIRVPKKVATIKKDFHSKRTSISALIVFEKIDSVQKALKMNGTVVDGHHIRVDKAVKDKAVDPYSAIFIGNLPLGIEDEKLWQVFGSCGEIDSVRVVRDKNTGFGIGVGYVNFKKSDAVELALMKNGFVLDKRELRVSRCSSNPKSRRKAKSEIRNKFAARYKEDQALKRKKAANREIDAAMKQKKLKVKNEDTSFQGQKVQTGKVAKKSKKEKMNPKKKQIVESLVKSMKKPKKLAKSV
ncbi:Hypothetical predicted protein [Cloeon dipterum]|uniref:RRM domain-containing protein n=1 Tax=Cloeon dipterum TaxID=197152 RepID=A0A8S1CMJ0_9INSE|nr:Hypothetical predicted protein [Cloeon dipterum]